MESPRVGTPIPFSQGGLKDVYVYRTNDGKWRIWFKSGQSSIDVLSIDRDALHSGSRSKLTVTLVEIVPEQTVQSLDASFKEAWNRLTPLQQKTLIAVLHGKGQRMRPAETARSINSPASSVRSALRALYNRNILWDDWNHGKLRVRLEDPFFAHWIRMTVQQ
jgi:hypothetical protein